MYLAILVSLAGFSFAAIAPSQSPDSLNVSVSVPESRLTSYPICGALGFTSEPGDNDLGVFPPPPICLDDCIRACRHNRTCRAVSYAPRYQLCSFYGRSLRFDHLDADNSSNFAHYDQVCHIGKEKPPGKGPRVTRGLV